MRLAPRAFSRDCTEYSDIPLYCEMKVELAFKPMQEFQLSFESGISVSTACEVPNSGSLSHTDCWGKAPLELIVGRWTTSLTESWESALFSTWYGVLGAFFEYLCLNWCSYWLETGVSGNLWCCPKEAKPIVLYDGKWGIALKPMQWSWSSFQVDLGYTELFDIPMVTSVSF